MFNLKTLATVIKSLTFADMILLGQWEGWGRALISTNSKWDTLTIPKGLVDWAKTQEEATPEEMPPPPETEIKRSEVPPALKKRLVIPEGSTHMILIAAIPTEDAEAFQLQLPDWPSVKYACDWIDDIKDDRPMLRVAADAWDAWFRS